MRHRGVFGLAVFLVLLTFDAVQAQNVPEFLMNKTFQRTFSAAGFKHKASYTFKKDRIIYTVHGFWINEKYAIIGKYQNGKFIGKDNVTSKKYIVYFQRVNGNQIKIRKQGVDPRYSFILRNLPVGGWHIYTLVR